MVMFDLIDQYFTIFANIFIQMIKLCLHKSFFAGMPMRAIQNEESIFLQAE